MFQAFSNVLQSERIVLRVSELRLPRVLDQRKGDEKLGMQNMCPIDVSATKADLSVRVPLSKGR